MRNGAVLQLINEDVNTGAIDAAERLLPMTEECETVWSLTNALYGGRPFDALRLRHVVKCSHCAERISRMASRVCPPLSVLKNLAADPNSESLVGILSKGFTKCAALLMGIRIGNAARVVPVPLFEPSVSFAPASATEFQPGGAVQLDEATEAIALTEAGELVLHVDSSASRTIGVWLLAGDGGGEQVTEDSAIFGLKNTPGTGDWTAKHSFGPVAEIIPRYGKYRLLAAVITE